jgi:hypothetical protein
MTSVKILGLAFILSSCMTSETGRPTLQDGKDVPLGRAAYVDGPTIKPIKIIEDSRCPVDAECAWAGRVIIEIIWVKAGKDERLEVISNEAVKLADGSLTLTDVQPGRTTETNLKPKDYRFTFEFAGGL